MPDPRRRNPIARLNQHCRHGDDPSALARLALEGPPPCAFCVFGRSFPRPIRLLIDAIQFHLHSLAVDGLAHEPPRRAGDNYLLARANSGALADNHRPVRLQPTDARVRTVGPTLRAEPTKRSFRRSATRRRVRPWLATRSGLSRQSLATSLL